MLVRMKETRRGWSNDLSCQQYMKGKEYELSDGLASHFINCKFAEAISCDVPTDRIGKMICRLLGERI